MKSITILKDIPHIQVYIRFGRVLINCADQYGRCCLMLWIGKEAIVRVVEFFEWPGVERKMLSLENASGKVAEKCRISVTIFHLPPFYSFFHVLFRYFWLLQVLLSNLTDKTNKKPIEETFRKIDTERCQFYILKRRMESDRNDGLTMAVHRKRFSDNVSLIFEADGKPKSLWRVKTNFR